MGYFDKTLDLDGNNGMASWENKGIVLQEPERNEEASQAFTTSVELNLLDARLDYLQFIFDKCL